MKKMMNELKMRLNLFREELHMKSMINEIVSLGYGHLIEYRDVTIVYKLIKLGFSDKAISGLFMLEDEEFSHIYISVLLKNNFSNNQLKLIEYGIINDLAVNMYLSVRYDEYQMNKIINLLETGDINSTCVKERLKSLGSFFVL